MVAVGSAAMVDAEMTKARADRALNRRSEPARQRQRGGALLLPARTITEPVFARGMGIPRSFGNAACASGRRDRCDPDVARRWPRRRRSRSSPTCTASPRGGCRWRTWTFLLTDGAGCSGRRSPAPAAAHRCARVSRRTAARPALPLDAGLARVVCDRIRRRRSRSTRACARVLRPPGGAARRAGWTLQTGIEPGVLPVEARRRRTSLASSPTTATARQAVPTTCSHRRARAAFLTNSSRRSPPAA